MRLRFSLLFLSDARGAVGARSTMSGAATLKMDVLQRHLDDMCRSLNMDEATSQAAFERLNALSAANHLEVLVRGPLLCAGRVCVCVCVWRCLMRSALPRAGWADWRLVQSADSERAWVVCALFVAGKSLVNFVSLSQLLKTANIECVILARRVVGDGSAGGAGGARVCVARCLTPTCARSHDGSMLVFFEHYKEFLSLSQMDDEPLKMLEKSYIVIKMLYDQYRKNYQKLFTYVPLSSVYVPSCVAMTDLAPICGGEAGRWGGGKTDGRTVGGPAGIRAILALIGRRVCV